MRTREWNRATVQTDFGQCLNLATLIKAVEKKCSVEGEVVCEIRVNGVVLDEEDEAKFAATEISKIENFSVKVSDVSNLLDDAIGALVDYIPEMIRVSLMTSERFRANEIESAHRSLESITQGSKWLVDMFSQLRRNRILTEKNVDGERWTRSEAELLTVTRELIKAFETKDYVLLADVLEYDWVTALQTWQSLLTLGGDDGRTGKTAPDSLGR